MLGLAVLLLLGLRLLARLSGHAPATATLPPLPAETLRQRADVRRAEFEVVAALAGVAGAQARRQPSFAIDGSLGLNAATLAGLTQGASVVSALLASVSLPLLDGGASRAELDSGRASLARALADVGAAVAGVTAARAALSTDQINLSKASTHLRTTNCRPARRSA